MMAGVHEMILRLPKGYETEIGEQGALLSGGQRQRIGLARAIYRRPALLVLDEPNSSLDATGEEALNQAIASMKASGSTIVVVAHRSSLLAHMDGVLVLCEGHMQLIGPRDHVLAQLSRQQSVGRPRVRIVNESRANELFRLPRLRCLWPLLPVRTMQSRGSRQSDLTLLGDRSCSLSYLADFGLWATLAPLTSAAIAPGVVKSRSVTERPFSTWKEELLVKFWCVKVSSLKKDKCWLGWTQAMRQQNLMLFVVRLVRWKLKLLRSSSSSPALRRSLGTSRHSIIRATPENLSSLNLNAVSPK